MLGVTDDLTIAGCVEAARASGGKIVVDMICVADLAARIRTVEELGVDYVSVHVGVDQQAAGWTPLDDLEIMHRTVTTAKVSVAGGINVESLSAYRALEPDIVIVGSGITHAADPVAAARGIHDALKEA